jgi:ferredoxin
MPNVRAEGKTFECEVGANLRQVMLQHGVNVYNGAAKTVNCHGLGTCGTCAVQVEGEVSEMGWREKTRLSLPPHSAGSNRRLSCQTQVLGDVAVTKYDGMWGQGNQVVWTAETATQ